MGGGGQVHEGHGAGGILMEKDIGVRMNIIAVPKSEIRYVNLQVVTKTSVL